ncbi:MAG: T9SS type A sorting domain-containing protein [Bacteroidia bacterium]|nr:T9SS type A sorting domain-containing protein [Bacteroidia bacterium]
MKLKSISLFSFFVLILNIFVSGQTATIPGGVINDYACVLDFDCVGNKVTVDNSAAFAAGDRCILIQMQGAEYDQSNSASYGNVINYHSAGKYEWVTISSITGNEIKFQYQFLNDYQPSGTVQLVRVPQYVNANITGALTAMPFDGCKGGILALEVQGLLDLRTGSSINLNGLGFRGYYQLQNNSSGCGSDYPGYYYSKSATGRGAPKGEGIGLFITNKDGGRGKQVSGGGGGNDHNSGGAGGGNFGGGGNGGQRLPYTAFWCPYPGISNGLYPGVGGLGMSSIYTNAENRIFLGSGGGAGHDNNATSFKGGNGGGILIVRAGTYRGRNKLQLVGGDDGILSAADAGSGGGAGGTILLDVGVYTDLHRLLVDGGDGANHSPSNVDNCMGPGGGGGGGVVWMSGGGIPAPNIGIIDFGGGAAGIDQNGTCGGTSQGAQAGQDGSVMYNLVMPESNTLPNNCVLAAKYADFSGYQAGRVVHLDWTTDSQTNSREFRIQRSKDGQIFESLSSIPAAGNSSRRLKYEAIDTDPYYGASFYRMQEIDQNGRSSLSPVIEVYFDPDDLLIQSVYPNPVEKGRELTVALNFNEFGHAHLLLFDLVGRVAWSDQAQMEPGKNVMSVPTSNLEDGVYFLKVNDGVRSDVRRIVISH